MSLNKSCWKHRITFIQRNPIIYSGSGTRLLHKDRCTWSFLMFNRRLQLRLKGLDLCLVSEKQHEMWISWYPTCAECRLPTPSLAPLVQRSVSQEPEHLPNPSPWWAGELRSPWFMSNHPMGSATSQKDCQNRSMNKRSHWPGGQLILFVFRDFEIGEITEIHFRAWWC